MSEINLLKKKWLFWLMVLEASVHGLLALLFGTRTRGGGSYLSHGFQETKKEEDDGVLPPELVLGERGPCCVGSAAGIPRYPLQSLQNIFSEMLIWGYN